MSTYYTFLCSLSLNAEYTKAPIAFTMLPSWLLTSEMICTDLFVVNKAKDSTKHAHDCHVVAKCSTAQIM